MKSVAGINVSFIVLGLAHLIIAVASSRRFAEL
jgi:hypothetical protein